MNLPEKSVTVTGELTGNDETMTVDVDVTVALERCGFYDDGRLVQPLTASFDAGEGRIETSLRRMTTLTGDAVYRAYVSGTPEDDDFEKLPNALRQEYRTAELAIDDESAAALEEVDQELADMLEVRRSELQNARGMSLDVGKRWTSGSGETHEIVAVGSVDFGDGRSVPIKWRNAVDIGFQVFINADDKSAALEDFSDDEVDAAVALARDESPITRSMRM